MKKYLLLFLLCFVPYSMAGDLIDIGSNLPKEAVDTGVMVMTSPSQFRKQYKIKFNDIEYSVCPDGDGLIVHISIRSPISKTLEGVRVGDALTKVQNITNSKIETRSGWTFVVPLPSGWNAAFVQGKSLTEGKLNNNSKVTFLFKGSASG